MKEKKVSKNVLERILTSHDFVNALDKSISITSDTGYETSFEVAKKIFGRKILFSPSIEIGDNQSVGSNIGLNRARRNYEKTASKRVNIRNLKEYPDFVSYCKNQNPVSVPLENIDFDKFIKNKPEAEKFYCLMHFHTHPKRMSAPSENDLRRLSFKKETNSLGGLNVSPINIIAGVSKNENYVPLLLLQENEKEIGKILDDNGNIRGHYSRFMDEEEFKQAQKETEAYWTTFSSKKGQILSLIFGRGPKTNFYNKGLMTYDRKNKKILSFSDLVGYKIKTDLSKFEFIESRE